MTAHNQTSTGTAAMLCRSRFSVKEVLRTCRRAFIGVGVFSAVINLLMLTGPLFMLQVYDRVLTSRSVPTLIALTVLVFGLYVFMGVLEYIRSRILARVGVKLDNDLSQETFMIWVKQGLLDRVGTKVQPLQELQTLKQFLGGPGPATLFDIPWVPLYLGLIYLLHATLGIVATIGAIIIFVLAYLNEVTTRTALETANRCHAQASSFASLSHRNAEAITVMGMRENICRHWQSKYRQAGQLQLAASDDGGLFTATSKALRLFLQAVMLAVGAMLVIQQEITPGTMIAASIIMGRALAPVDQAIGQWKGFAAARQSYHRLAKVFQSIPPQQKAFSLPSPLGKIVLDEVFFIPFNTEKAALENIHFTLEPGQALGVIGSTASGKSTLARLLTGIWLPSRGTVRLDGATLDQWNPDVLGRHIGYLPQDVELLDGTVRDNIARFDEEAEDEAIITAAKQAGVHQMILGLPQGYKTPIGEGGAFLSGGQRQRIALARALYGQPKLVILDEPNANLDMEGDAALIQAIKSLKQQGTTVIIITHRPNAIAVVDLLLMLKDGKQQAFGPKDSVLRYTMRTDSATPIANQR